MRSQVMLSGLFLLAVGAPTMAQREPEGRSPYLVARRHIAHIGDAAARAVQRMSHQAQRCARLIDTLQAGGRTDEVEAAAQRCIELIDEIARVAAQTVDRIAMHAIAVLTELDAPQQLLDLVNRTAQAARDAILSAHDRALAEIQAALSDT